MTKIDELRELVEAVGRLVREALWVVAAVLSAIYGFVTLIETGDVLMGTIFVLLGVLIVEVG